MRNVWIAVGVFVVILGAFVVWVLVIPHYEVEPEPVVNGPYKLDGVILLYDLSNPAKPLVGLLAQSPENVPNNAWNCAIQHPGDRLNPVVIKIEDADSEMFGFTLQPVYRVYPFVGLRKCVGMRSVFTLYIRGGVEEVGSEFLEPRSADDQLGHQEPGDYLKLTPRGGPSYPAGR